MEKEKKMTQAQIAEYCRLQAMEKVIKTELIGKELLQVDGTKYMINIIDPNGDTRPVRIDIVFPKIKEDDTCQYAEDFADFYLQEQEEKRIAKEEKEKQKQKKIARDKKLREKKKENKGE